MADSHEELTLETSRDDVDRRYREQGYVVFRNAIPDAAIETFLVAYRRIRSHPLFVYYSQSFQRCMRPKLSPQGFIMEAMQNASRLRLFGGFARSFQRCIYHANASRALSLVSGARQHVSWQNMFFDQSTGTVEHQDSWYLDTDPAGDLMGVWYALEDIDERAGAFFVGPGSHALGLLDRAQLPRHEDFVAATRTLIREHKIELRPMLLRRGDILIWHPFLIHGAFEQKDPRLSRKSFTSHFYPLGARAKDTEAGKRISIYDHAHPRPTENPDIFTAYRFPDLIYQAIVYGKYAVDTIRGGKQYLDMGRRAYR